MRSYYTERTKRVKLKRKGEVFLKMKKHFLFFILFLILTANVVLAFGPATHYYITKKAVETAPDTPNRQIALRHLNAYLAGSEHPDISVIFYFTSFESYTFTHNWEYCNKMLTECAEDEEDKAFALGCFAHLAADSYAHNTFVPYYIAKYSLMDEPSLHPIVEEALDKKYYAENPDLQNQVNNMLNGYEKYARLITCTAKTDEIGGLKISNLMAIHKGALSDFYDKGYGAQNEYFGVEKPAGYTRIAVFWKLFKFVNTPIAKYVITLDNTEQVESEAIVRIQNTLSGSPDTQYDPSGAIPLRKANTTPRIIQSVLSVLIVIIMFFIVRVKFMSKLRFWGWVLSGIISLLVAVVLYYMGFLGVLLLVFFMWLLSWIVVAVSLLKILVRKEVPNKFFIGVIIFNIIIDLFILWVKYLL